MKLDPSSGNPSRLKTNKKSRVLLKTTSRLFERIGGPADGPMGHITTKNRASGREIANEKVVRQGGEKVTFPFVITL